MANVDSVMHNRNLARIKQAERELEELEGKDPAEEQEAAEPVIVSTEEPAVRKAEVQEEVEQDEELSAEEKSFKKRYGDLRRHAQEQKKELEARLEKLEGQLKQSANKELVLPKTQQDIDAWAKKYPDVAGIVETIAAKKAQEMFKKAEDRLSQLDEIQYEAERKTAEAKISESHPDFSKLRESDSFHQWAEEQPKWVRDALYENMDDPDSVVRVIDLYKIDTGHTTQDKKAKTKAAAKPIGRGSRTQVDPSEGGSVIRESDVNKMSSAEFEAREEEISKAMRTGKFVYDLTGSAR